MSGAPKHRDRMGEHRTDRLLRELVHDPYESKRKLAEPSVCRDCGVVYLDGRWTSEPAPADASGEEPYTLALIWHYLVARRLPALGLRILGTDIDDVLLQRAQQACYPLSSLKGLPGEWLAEAFEEAGNGYRLKRTITDNVRFRKQDLRNDLPDDRDFDLVLCRNLAFTYFDDNLQCRTAATLNRSLRGGGALVLGKRERLPDAVAGFIQWSSVHRVYRKLAAAMPAGPRQ